jgi:hypothetical protein
MTHTWSQQSLRYLIVGTYNADIYLSRVKLDTTATHTLSLTSSALFHTQIMQVCKLSGGRPLESLLNVVATVGRQIVTLKSAFTYDAPRIIPRTLGLWSEQGEVAQESDNVTLVSTRGGRVTFRGENLMSGNSSAETFVTFGIGPSFDSYKCALDRANSTDARIVCMAPPGVGKGYRLLVRINGRKYVGADVLSYPSPSLTPGSMRLKGQTAGSRSVNGTSTIRGLDVLELHGQNFGPASSDISVTYGPLGKFIAKYVCKVLGTSEPHTRIDCEVGSGVGTGLVFNVTIGRQTISSSDVFNYPAPVITSSSLGVIHPDGTMHASEGSSSVGGVDVVLLTGANFGPDPMNVVVVYRGGLNLGTITCNVLVAGVDLSAHTSLRCLPSSGAGGPYTFNITVGGQSVLTTSTQSFRYPAPVFKTSSLRTMGNQCLSPMHCGGYFAAPGSSRVVTRSSLSSKDVVEIEGANFGPWSSILNVTLGRRVAGVYRPLSQCLTIPAAAFAVNHTRLQCILPAYVGVGYVLQVTAGGQVSTESSDIVSYHDPVIYAGKHANKIENDFCLLLG